MSAGNGSESKWQIFRNGSKSKESEVSNRKLKIERKLKKIQKNDLRV